MSMPPSYEGSESSPEFLRESLSQAFGLHDDVLNSSLVVECGGEHEDQNQASKDLLASASALVGLDPVFKSGEPGHTPFPYRNNPRYAMVSSLSSTPVSMDNSGYAADLSLGQEPVFADVEKPLVPFNSPDDSYTEAAMRQSEENRDSLLRKKLSEIHSECEKKSSDFRTPSRIALPLPRKRLQMRNASQLADSDTSSANLSYTERETERRTRVANVSEQLKTLVPGLEDKDDIADVYETTAKYLAFLRSRVGSTYDKDFLGEVLPY